QPIISMTLAPLSSLGLVHRNQSTRCDGPTSLCNQAQPFFRRSEGSCVHHLRTRKTRGLPIQPALPSIAFPVPLEDNQAGIPVRAPEPTLSCESAQFHHADPHLQHPSPDLDPLQQPLLKRNRREGTAGLRSVHRRVDDRWH